MTTPPPSQNGINGSDGLSDIGMEHIPRTVNENEIDGVFDHTPESEDESNLDWPLDGCEVVSPPPATPTVDLNAPAFCDPGLSITFPMGHMISDDDFDYRHAIRKAIGHEISLTAARVIHYFEDPFARQRHERIMTGEMATIWRVSRAATENRPLRVLGVHMSANQRAGARTAPSTVWITAETFPPSLDGSARDTVTWASSLSGFQIDFPGFIARMAQASASQPQIAAIHRSFQSEVGGAAAFASYVSELLGDETLWPPPPARVRLESPSATFSRLSLRA